MTSTAFFVKLVGLVRGEGERELKTLKSDVYRTPLESDLCVRCSWCISFSCDGDALCD